MTELLEDISNDSSPYGQKCSMERPDPMRACYVCYV